MAEMHENRLQSGCMLTCSLPHRISDMAIAEPGEPCCQAAVDQLCNMPSALQ